MDGSFEKQFSELQADMISVCFEYCERKSDTIFVHFICENNSIFANFFFRIDGNMRKKGRLDDSGTPVSVMRQKEALSIITNDMRAILSLCDQNSKPVPTEIRIVYDVKKDSLRADYHYDQICSSEKTDRAVSDEWFDELSQEN